MSELHRQLDDLAHRGEPRGADAVLAGARRALPAPAPTPGRAPRVATALLVVTLVVALAAGVLIATRDGGGDGAVAVAEDSGQRGGQPLFLLPAEVPEGFFALGSWGGEEPGEEGTTVGSGDWTRIQRWVRFGEGGRPAEVVDVSWGPVDGAADPLARFRPGSVRTVVRDLDALHSPAEGRLVWEEPGAGVVLVTGTAASPAFDPTSVSPLPPALLTDVAERLQRRSDGGFDMPQPPPGLERVAEWPGLASEGTNVRSARYARPGGGELQVQIVDDSELPPGINLGLSVAHRTRVRGQPGVLTPVLYGPLSTGSSEVEPLVGNVNLQWLERGGERITLSAQGVDESVLLAVAERLEPVDLATWRALGGSPAPTTTQVPTTTSPSTTAPPPELDTEHVQVQGTYRGLERFELFTGPCGFTSHVLESTFELADGGTWRFRSDYCGSLDGDVWTGRGTFTFTTEDGATISGDTGNSARLPTTGVPYELDVTDGTGSFADATGSCALDNHLREIRFGVQEQFGTFSCDIDRPTAPR